MDRLACIQHSCDTANNNWSRVYSTVQQANLMTCLCTCIRSTLRVIGSDICSLCTDYGDIRVLSKAIGGSGWGYYGSTYFEQATLWHDMLSIYLQVNSLNVH
jgi:hypothetical protein